MTITLETEEIVEILNKYISDKFGGEFECDETRFYSSIEFKEIKKLYNELEGNNEIRNTL